MSVTFWQWCQWRWSPPCADVGRRTEESSNLSWCWVFRCQGDAWPPWLGVTCHAKVVQALNEQSPWKHSPVGGCLTIETDWKRNTASASMSYSPKNPNVLFPGLHMTSFSGTSQLALLYRHFWDNPAINFGATWRSVKPPGRRGNEAKVLLAHATAVDAFDIFILALRRSQQMDQGEGSSPWLNEWVVSRVKLCFFVGRIHPQLLGNWGNIRH